MRKDNLLQTITHAVISGRYLMIRISKERFLKKFGKRFRILIAIGRSPGKKQLFYSTQTSLKGSTDH